MVDVILSYSLGGSKTVQLIVKTRRLETNSDWMNRRVSFQS